MSEPVDAAMRQTRDLIRAADRASLAVTMADGGPYASLVMTACDPAGRPLLLISALAEHTQAIQRDPRVSLLFDGTAGLDEPLTGARATLLGVAEKVDDDGVRARYLARHPSAAGFAGFGDFAFYRIQPKRAHLVAGFGRIRWIDGDDLILGDDALGDLPAQEAGVVEHMNEDHADAVAAYAEMLNGPQPEDAAWILTGVDAEGGDLRWGGKTLRLTFDKPVVDAEGARVELVRLVKRARREIAEQSS